MMRKGYVIDLEECTEYCQVLRSGPRYFAHVLMVLLTGVLVATVIWLALTQASLIVVGSGRVRPKMEPTRIFSGERFSTHTGGRVAVVNYQEGQAVRQGEVLMRMDTTWVDNEIAKAEHTIETGQAELNKFKRLSELAVERYETQRAKAQQELRQMAEQVEQNKTLRLSQIHLAELTLTQAKARLERIQALFDRQTANPLELEEAQMQVEKTKEELLIKQIPVDESGVEVARQALQLVSKEYDLRRQELLVEQSAKLAAIEAANLDLDRLMLQRDQAQITAPVDGVVISREFKVGDVIDPGEPVVAIAQGGGLRMDVELTSQDVGHIREGMAVRVKFDAYDYQQFGTLAGQVVFVSPDSRISEGAGVGSPQPGVPAYTIRVALDRDEVRRGNERGEVKLGMTGQVEIITGHERLLTVLLRKIRRTISLS